MFFPSLGHQSHDELHQDMGETALSHHETTGSLRAPVSHLETVHTTMAVGCEPSVPAFTHSVYGHETVFSQMLFLGT